MAYKYNPFTNNFDDVGTAGGGGGTPGGSDTYVQFNDGGAFGGDIDLTWNKTTNVLGIAGDVNLSDGGTYTTTLQTITPTAARTISLPDATGTVALVAGSSGQLLWNNAGVNAGASTLTYDGSILTSSGRFINSYNATASSPAKAFTGTWFTGGTGTTTKPQVLIEPTGTTSTGWSTSGTGLGVNAASTFSGNLLDLQVNGTSQAKISANGILALPNKASGNYIEFGGVSISSQAGGVWLGISTRLVVSGVSSLASIDTGSTLTVSGSASTIGYATGSGGAVTQGTDRATGVTLNKGAGAITLVSAAGTTTWTSFTVTNSTVAATDVVKVCQKSGTDSYQIFVTNVAAGTFRITFATTGGTTTEQPVFNFVVIKAVTA